MRRIVNAIISFRQYDWLLTTVVFILLIFSFASIYSIDLSRGNKLFYFPTQLLAFSIGSIGLIIAARLHMTFYQSVAKLLYLAAFVMLILVLLIGDSARGTTGWFRVGGFSFQPAEFAKFALIIVIGFLINKQGRRFYKLQFVVLSGLLFLLLAGLILLQPDLGSALVLGAIWFGLLLLSGVKKRYILALIVMSVFIFVFSWSFLFQDYQKERLLTFLKPQENLLGSGYNVNQSIIAIGAGKFLGRGLGFGSQSQLHFLPEAQTDFIFSVIAEELGFFGTTIVLVLYAVLIWRLLYIARQSRNEFGVYVVLGIIILFFTQIVFNVGAATGLLPVTGLTLPFVSYGGSSLVINLLLIGIAQSIARSNWENQKENILYG